MKIEERIKKIKKPILYFYPTTSLKNNQNQNSAGGNCLNLACSCICLYINTLGNLQ